MPAPVDVGKIIVGSGKLEISEDGGTAWTELGGTEDGVELNMSKDFHDTEAAEAPVTLKKTLTNITGTVSTGLLESTLDNLLLSWPGEIDDSATDIKELTIGVEDVDVEEIDVKFTGKGPDGAVRTIHFEKAISIGDGGHTYTKGADTVITTEFEVLADWDDDYGDDGGWVFGTVEDDSTE